MATFTPPSLHAVARTAFALLVFALTGSAYGQTPGSARGKPDVSESYLRQMSVNAAGYCPSQGGSRAYENIKNVSWEILGNQIAFTVEIFIANPLNCQSGKPCPSYDPSPEHVNGWIDWDGDGIWQQRERVINLDLTGYAALNYSGTLTAYTTAPIPASHVGDVQMRVNLGWGFDPNDPCTPNWNWGDVKDYPVSICNSKSQEESDACSPYSVQSIRVAGELNKFKNADGSPNSNTLLTNNACKITDSPDPQAFSAPLAVSLQLESTLFNCVGNAGDESPELDFSLSIPQANISKSDKFTGKVHKVSFITPGKVGIYDVILTYRLKGKNKPAQEPITIKRKLYVTYDLSKIEHKISTLEKGCTWAAGLNQEGLIVDKLLTEVYAYGRANWRYGYDFGSKTKCTWEDLIDNAGCNYSDCHIFSQVLVNVSAVLGIGNFSQDIVEGKNNLGLVTFKNRPSLDPQFIGSAHPTGGGYDRYLFGNHNLQRKNGAYYDATFGRKYQSRFEFIEWHLSGTDAFGITIQTSEGAKLYEESKNSYDGWPSYRYVPPPGNKTLVAHGKEAGAVQSENAAFTRQAQLNLINADADPLYERLAIAAELDIQQPGEYRVSGRVLKGDSVIANVPYWQAPKFSSVASPTTAGKHAVTLTFSGEQLFRSGANGPYRVTLAIIGENGLEDTLTVTTPGYAFTQFGEVGVSLNQIVEKGKDVNQDGKYDSLAVDVALTVRAAGTYILETGVAKEGQTIATVRKTVALNPGSTRTLLQIPGRSINRSAFNGPYEILVNLYDQDHNTLESKTIPTKDYKATDFQYALLDLNNLYDDQGIDLNGNEKFDLLRVSVGGQFDSLGVYRISAVLTQADTSFVASADTLWTAQAGTNSIVLDFAGLSINASEANGPYSLYKLELFDQENNLLDYLYPMYKTNPYPYTNFEESVSVGSAGDFTVTVKDTNANQLYDQLLVNLAVTSTRDGVVFGVADLYDNDGKRIANGSGFVPVKANTAVPVPIGFDGRYLFGNLKNGPYTIRNVFFYPTGDISKGVRIDSLGRTGAYAYNAFEPAAVITGVVEKIPAGSGYAVGAQVSSEETYDVVDQKGYYRLIYFGEGKKTVRVSDPQNSQASWLVYANNVLVGQQDSAAIDVKIGEIDTVQFIAPTVALPTILAILPDSAAPGQALEVTVSGRNTHFGNASKLNMGAGITVLSTNAVNAQTLKASIRISPTATPGYRDVTVTTGTETAAENVPGPFRVLPPDSTGVLVQSFTLVDADTDQNLVELKDNDTLNLAAFASLHLNIRANTRPDTVGSVVFDLDGKKVIENNAPYAYAGNAGSDYKAFTPAPGNHVLKATPYRAKAGAGEAGQALTVRFHVVYQAVTRFTLMDADADQPIREIKEGDVIDLSQLPSQRVNIRATTSPNPVGSVVFDLDGKQAVERVSPYAYAANKKADYFAFTLPVGNHVLTATPYSKPIAAGDTAGNGFKGKSLTVRFSVTGLAVSELVLLDADTDKDIRTIKPGDVIDLSTLPAGHLNVRAVTNPDTVGSVTFKLDDQPVVRENYSPYAIGGDLNGDFRSWELPTGMHTLTVTPHTGKNGAGNQGVAYTAAFRVVRSDASARAGSGYGKEGIGGLQAAPNPFTGRTTLSFSTLAPGFTTLDVLNARGETVARLFGGHAEPDKAYSVTFAAGQLPSGLYLARLVTHQKVTYYKLIHLK